MTYDFAFFRTAALGAIALGQTLFVLLYLTFPWWATFLGRALFGKAIALAVLIDLGILYRIHPFPYADGIFTVLYIVLAIGVWWQLFAFFRIRLAGRQDRVSGNRHSNRRVNLND